MERKELEDAIVEVVRPLVQQFRDTPGEAHAKHAAAVAALEDSIEAADNPVVKKALNDGLRKLEKEGPGKEDRGSEEQKAWNAAARRLGVTTRATRARRAAGSRLRRSADAVEKAAEQVKDTLEDAVYYTRSEIAEKTDMAEDLLRSALARLKREGEIESNGERGVRGAYRKVKDS